MPINSNRSWKMLWNYRGLVQMLQWFVLLLERWWQCLLFEFILTLFDADDFLGKIMFIITDRI